LTALRSLAIPGLTSTVAVDAPRQAASEQLARAIGALTGLETLSLLSGLEDCVSAHDGYAHLGRLKGLRALSMGKLGSWLPEGWQGDEDSGEALVDMMTGMLPGMTRLTSLSVTSCHMTTDRAACALSAQSPEPEVVSEGR
jgi:hypothetical protein